MVALQNFNIHRLQFDKYNVPHIAFTGLLFAARVVWKQIVPVLGGGSRISFGDAIRFSIFLLLSYALAKSVRELATKHNFQTVMYLGYPCLLYVSVFGAVMDSGIRWYFSRFAESPRQHGDFLADAIAQIVYGSLEAAYYAAALPMRFLSDSNLVYDKTTNVVVVIVLFFTMLCVLTTNLMSTSWQMLFTQARKLGYWTETKKNNSNAATWGPASWKEGEWCKHKKKTYIAGSTTSVEPGDTMTELFYKVFHSPLYVLNAIVLCNFVVLVVEVVLIITARRWNVVCWFTMFCFSFMTLAYACQVRRHVVIQLLDEEHVKKS